MVYFIGFNPARLSRGLYFIFDIVIVDGLTRFLYYREHYTWLYGANSDGHKKASSVLLFSHVPISFRVCCRNSNNGGWF